MKRVTGPSGFQGQTNAFTYLDLMFRPARYESADVIFVKNKLVRAELRRALEGSLDAQLLQMEASGHAAGAGGPANDEVRRVFTERMSWFMKTGMISPMMLGDRAARQTLERLSADLMRTARFVDAIESAQTISQPAFLGPRLRLLPPPGGGMDDAWYSLDDLAAAPPADARFAVIPAEMRASITRAWTDLREGWLAADVVKVNGAAAALGELLPQVPVEAGVYPQRERLKWESWYFRQYNLTWFWIFYALALVPLLMFVVFRWRGAGWAGLGMFALAFGLHTFSVMLRWYVADRWPNSNMFEAVTTSAWFGGCLALVLEVALRRHALRGLFAVASAVSSMVALMCAWFMPLQLDGSISNMMPVLHDVWLYIHTNVIIFSYCLIFMAAVAAVLYLARRIIGAIRGDESRFAYARIGGTGMLLAGSRPQERSNLGQVLDGATMILMEFSFVLLWAGIVMGAIWADHSWGRPWGWDPKEVFALNTFIVFAILVHVRLKVRDKGLWTALIAVVGAIVMVFNWVVINFTIAGLHSYA